MSPKDDFLKIKNPLKEENTLLKMEIETYQKRLDESQIISQIGSWEWNLLDNSIYWSNSMFSILGLLPSKDTPSYELALKHVHEDDKVRYEKKLKYSIENKVDYYFENKIRTENNEIISVISKGKCICSEENEIIRMVGTVQDISLVKELLESTRQLNNFAKNLSHEIKSPVNTIIGFINLLKTSIYRKSSDKEKLYLNAIEKSAEELDLRISEIINKTKLK